MSQEFAYKELLRRVSRGAAEEEDQLWVSIIDEPDPLNTDQGRIEFQVMVHDTDMSVKQRLKFNVYPSYVPDLLKKFRDPYCGWQSEIYLLGAEINEASKAKPKRCLLRIWDTQQKLSAMHPPPKPASPGPVTAPTFASAPAGNNTQGDNSETQRGAGQQASQEAGGENALWHPAQCTPPPAAPPSDPTLSMRQAHERTLRRDTMPSAAAATEVHTTASPREAGKQQPCGHPLLDRTELVHEPIIDGIRCWRCSICGKLYEEAGE
jgi:hypothetical protein